MIDKMDFDGILIKYFMQT